MADSNTQAVRQVSAPVNRLEGQVRYLAIEVDDVLQMVEHTEV